MRLIIFLVMLASVVADMMFIALGKVWCAILFIIIPIMVLAMFYDRLFKDKSLKTK